MKGWIRLVLCLAILQGRFLPGSAQEVVDYQRERQLVELMLEDETVLDSLVDRMIQHAYLLKASEAELIQKHQMVKQEKRSWLSTFTMGISLYNQSTVYDDQSGSSVTNVGVLPNLGVSLTVNPERLVNMPSNVKIAQQDVLRIENTMKEQRRTLKVFITGKYYEYLEALNILELRISTHERQRQQATQARRRFERGEAKLEEVILAQNGLADAEESLMRARVSILKLKKEIDLFTTDSA